MAGSIPKVSDSGGSTADVRGLTPPVPGSPGWVLDYGTRVLRGGGGEEIAAPIVLESLARFSPDGRIVQSSVTLRVGKICQTVTLQDVAEGVAWQLFPGEVQGAGTKRVREVLHNAVLMQIDPRAIESVTPRWVDGRMTIPRNLCDGYGTVQGTLAEFRDLLRFVGPAARMCLAMGFAVGGVFLEPLQLDSFIVLMPGASKHGKTTTLQLCASLFGSPRKGGIIRPFNATGNGVAARLRELTFLPAFRDELGAGKFRPSELEALVFKLTEGAERDVSQRDGFARASMGGWHGVLMATGNEGIVDRIANEGIAARVLEFGGPFGVDAEHGKAVRTRVRSAGVPYGHGLALLVGSGVDPLAFEAMREQAALDLAAPVGGPEEAIGQAVSVGLAGARLLAELTGVAELGGSQVDTVAGELLAGLVAELAERGHNPGDVLLRALADAMASEPEAWPTRQTYEAAISGAQFAPRLPREIYGWDITSDSAPGDVAVIPGQLRKLADAAGLVDPMLAIKDLRKRGRLVPDADGKNLARRVRVGSKAPRAYVIAGLDDAGSDLRSDTAAPSEPDVPTSVPTSVPTPDLQCSDSSDLSRKKTSREPGGEPDSVQVGGPCERCADPGLEWCGFGRATDERAPCSACGELTSVRSRCGAVRHAHPAGTATAPAETPAVAGGANHPRKGPRRSESLSEPPAQGYLETWLTGAAGFTEATPEELAEAGRLWNAAMRNVRFSGPYDTAMRLLNGALQHPSIPELGALDPAHLEPITAVNGGMVPRWVFARTVPGPELEVGSELGAYDVNAAYASAAAIPLGTGAPTLLERGKRRGLAWLPERWAKAPGWVQADRAIDDAPYGLGGRIEPGTWVPVPLAAYLAEHKLLGGARAALLWSKSRAWLKPHVDLLREARYSIQPPSSASPGHGLAGRMALAAIKATAVRMFGGALRSKDHNKTATQRSDWGAMVEAMAHARMLRGLDKVTGARVVGIHMDAAWFVLPEGGGDPAGLLAVDAAGRPQPGQLGKFKPAGKTLVTQEIVTAHRVGRWRPIYDALSAEEA